MVLRKLHAAIYMDVQEFMVTDNIRHQKVYYGVARRAPRTEASASQCWGVGASVLGRRRLSAGASASQGASASEGASASGRARLGVGAWAPRRRGVCASASGRRRLGVGAGAPLGVEA